MKVYKTTIIPAVEEKVSKVFFHTVCDLCGVSDEGGDWPVGTTNKDNNVNKIEIEWKTGWKYGVDENYDKFNIDMCPSCFQDRLLPWLKSQGAEPRITDSDY